MKRFRFTFLAICLLLVWLGGNDLLLQLRNPAPLTLNLHELPDGDLPQEWLQLQSGHLDLLQGINMSGTIEIDTFLIPLVTEKGIKNPRVWVETRNPAVMDLLTTYYFKLGGETEQQEFLKENAEAFFPRTSVTGMTADNLIANANEAKLVELLAGMGIQANEQVIFLSEGKEPNRWRGPVFVLLAIVGLLKFALWNRRSEPK